MCREVRLSPLSSTLIALSTTRIEVLQWEYEVSSAVVVCSVHETMQSTGGLHCCRYLQLLQEIYCCTERLLWDALEWSSIRNNS